MNVMKIKYIFNSHVNNFGTIAFQLRTKKERKLANIRQPWMWLFPTKAKRDQKKVKESKNHKIWPQNLKYPVLFGKKIVLCNSLCIAIPSLFYLFFVKFHTTSLISRNINKFRSLITSGGKIILRKEFPKLRTFVHMY